MTVANDAEDDKDGMSRLDLILQHPLMTKASLATQPIDELCRIVKRVILLRESGYCFVGPSGIGKTFGINSIKQYVAEHFPQVCSIFHDTQNHQVPSIRAFFKHFLTTVGHADLKGETYDLRLKVQNRLIDDARQKGMNLILLVIDEAHAMDIQDFFFLKDIDNALAHENVHLVTMLFGQEREFKIVRQKVVDKARQDLIGRFMLRTLFFPALKNLHDVAAIMKQIDEHCYPVGSSCTWTQFFFPMAWTTGFRAENEAPSLYKALRKAGLNNKKGNVISARQLFLAIRYLFLEYAGEDQPQMILPENAWNEAVKYAKLEESMQAASQFQKDGSGFTVGL